MKELIRIIRNLLIAATLAIAPLMISIVSITYFYAKAPSGSPLPFVGPGEFFCTNAPCPVYFYTYPVLLDFLF